MVQEKVLTRQERAYRTLFGNLFPHQIAKRLTLYYNYPKSISKKFKSAYVTLFGSDDVKNVVETLNRKWIDKRWFIIHHNVNDGIRPNGWIRFRALKNPNYGQKTK